MRPSRRLSTEQNTITRCRATALLQHSPHNLGGETTAQPDGNTHHRHRREAAHSAVINRAQLSVVVLQRALQSHTFTHNPAPARHTLTTNCMEHATTAAGHRDKCTAQETDARRLRTHRGHRCIVGQGTVHAVRRANACSARQPQNKQALARREVIVNTIPNCNSNNHNNSGPRPLLSQGS